MPGIVRVNQDTAGGLITGSGLQDFVKLDGMQWAVLGDVVAPHGTVPHAAATMVQGSAFIKINGIPACIAGNAASCGDVATGSPDMQASA